MVEGAPHVEVGIDLEGLHQGAAAILGQETCAQRMTTP